MLQYLLDTNTVSYALKAHPFVTQHLLSVPMAALSISVITEGELLFGLAKRPAAKALHRAVTEFLLRVEVLPWDRAAAACYGSMRASLNQKGHVLAPLDLLIAAHAQSTTLTLVSNDRAFRNVPGLDLEDWTLQ